jgi:hypothetical protein
MARQRGWGGARGSNSSVTSTAIDTT